MTIDLEKLVRVALKLLLVIFVFVIVLWCRPRWWGAFGIHYYENVGCFCYQCELIEKSERHYGKMRWRFK